MTIFEKWKRESCPEESKALRLRCQKYWGRGNGRGCPLPQLTRKSGSTSLSMSGLRLDAKFILKHSSVGTSVFIHLKGFFLQILKGDWNFSRYWSSKVGKNIRKVLPVCRPGGYTWIPRPHLDDMQGRVTSCKEFKFQHWSVFWGGRHPDTNTSTLNGC